MKLAVVGTSHINSIKSALDSSQQVRSRFESVFYFGLNAPILSKQNHEGWPCAQGNMSVDIPEGRAFLNRIFKDPLRVFDPKEYDVILLVDMFFCYDFSFVCRDANDNALSIDKSLVSDITFREIIKAQLGKSKYPLNSVLGEVPENSLIPLLTDIRQAAPSASIHLTPRPMIPDCEFARNKVRMNSSSVLQGAKIFDDAAQSLLNTIGINYIPRELTQVCCESGLTPMHFSTGVLDSQPPRLDEHMNSEYGRIVLTRLINNVNAESTMESPV